MEKHNDYYVFWAEIGRRPLKEDLFKTYEDNSGLSGQLEKDLHGKKGSLPQLVYIMEENQYNSPVMPWLFMQPILYSAFSEGSRAAPMVMPSIMALNLRTMGFFSRPSGS